MPGASKSTMVAMVQPVLIALTLALVLPGYAAGATFLPCMHSQAQAPEAGTSALRPGCCRNVTAAPAGVLEFNSRARLHQPIVSGKLSAVYPRAQADLQLGLIHARPSLLSRRIYVLTRRLRL